MTLHLEALSSSIYRNIQECIRNESIEGSDFPEPLLFASVILKYPIHIGWLKCD